MWKDKPLYREMLQRSQCSQQTASPAQKTGNTELGSMKNHSTSLEGKYPGCSPKFERKTQRPYYGGAINRPETTELPPITEVVWQQPQKTHLIDMNKNSINNNNNNSTHTLEFKRKNDVESQTSPIKESSGSDTESLMGNQTRSTPVQGPNDSKKQQREIQRNETDMKTYGSRDDNVSPPRITTSESEERFVRDDITNELYMSLSSTIVL